MYSVYKLILCYNLLVTEELGKYTSIHFHYFQVHSDQCFYLLRSYQIDLFELMFRTTCNYLQIINIWLEYVNPYNSVTIISIR